MSKTTASNKNHDYDTTAEAIAKREARDEMWRVSTSLQAVSALMIPEADLNAVNREDLATLLIYLTDKLKELMEKTD